MFIPKLVVKKIDYKRNVRIICRFLSDDMKNNKTRDFVGKTLQLYPELKSIYEEENSDIRKQKMEQAVLEKLHSLDEEIDKRVIYFQHKFDEFIPQFIESQCKLFNYEWKNDYPVIECYVGYMPFYPRSAEKKLFFVSYQDEERVFSGAVHEINHMVFWEKWKEMHNIVTHDEEPGFPEPLWFVQEIIVDPTLNDNLVRKHTLFENKAYEQFYRKKSNNKSTMDIVKDMYDSKSSIEDFLIKMLTFATENYDMVKD